MTAVALLLHDGGGSEVGNDATLDELVDNDGAGELVRSEPCADETVGGAVAT